MSSGGATDTRDAGITNAGFHSRNDQASGSGVHSVFGSAGEGGAGGDMPGENSDDETALTGGAAGSQNSNANSEANSIGGAGSPPCLSTTDGLIQAGYFPDVRLALTQDIHPFIELTGGEAPIALERISIRYYFTNESDSQEVAACYYLSGNLCQAAQLRFVDIPRPTATATRALEVRFAAGTGLFVGLSPVELHVGFAAGSSWLRQSNDYSFDSGASSPIAGSPIPYKRWERVLVYVDDVLAWGTEPCRQADAVSTQP